MLRDYLEISTEVGIVGLGGACFPTHVKLAPPEDCKIDSIIINAAECEPYLTCDHRLMLENSNELTEGLKILLHMFPNTKIYVGIENNKKDAIEIMKKSTCNVQNIEIVPLRTKYPQGAEKQLIYATTKRQVPSGK